MALASRAWISRSDADSALSSRRIEVSKGIRIWSSRLEPSLPAPLARSSPITVNGTATDLHRAIDQRRGTGQPLAHEGAQHRHAPQAVEIGVENRSALLDLEVAHSSMNSGRNAAHGGCDAVESNFTRAGSFAYRFGVEDGGNGELDLGRLFGLEAVGDVPSAAARPGSVGSSAGRT